MTLNSSSSMFSDPQLESLLAGLATNEAETLIRTSALIQHISYRDGFGFKLVYFTQMITIEPLNFWLFRLLQSMEFQVLFFTIYRRGKKPCKDQPKMRFVNLVQFRNSLHYWIIHVQKSSELRQKQLRILSIRMIQQSWTCVAVGDSNLPSGKLEIRSVVASLRNVVF